MRFKRVVIPLVAFGVAFTIAGASWVKHQSVRTKQGECRGYLKAVVLTQASSLAEFRRLDLGDGFNPDQGGNFMRRPAHRYLYAFAPDASGLVTHDDGGVNEPSRGTDGGNETVAAPGLDANASALPVTGHGPDAFYGLSSAALWALWPAPILAELGPRGTCPDCSITVGCITNLDGDSTPDVWTVSTADRRRGETVIRAGTSWHEIDDDDWPWSRPPGPE